LKTVRAGAPGPAFRVAITDPTYRRSMRFDYIFFKVRAGPGLYSVEDIMRVHEELPSE
jgi:hypothetical protein